MIPCIFIKNLTSYIHTCVCNSKSLQKIKFQNERHVYIGLEGMKIISKVLKEFKASDQRLN